MTYPVELGLILSHSQKVRDYSDEVIFSEKRWKISTIPAGH